MMETKRLLEAKRVENPTRVLDKKIIYAQTIFELSNGSEWTPTSYESKFYDDISRDTGITAEIIGYSYENRPIYALSVGTGKVTTVISSGVHRDEPASREAVLQQARDMAYNLDSKYSNYLSKYRVVFVPTVSPDVLSRNNAQGLNINRDAYALETPEMRVLMSLIADTLPEVHIDHHERSGNIARVEFINSNTFDPNTDADIKTLSTTFVGDIMDSMGDLDYITDFYPSNIIGPSMSVSASMLLGSLSFTPETHYGLADRNFRIQAHKDIFDLVLDWHETNASTIQGVRQRYVSNMLKAGDTFTLLNGDNQYYTNATEVEIVLPESYLLEDRSAFAVWEDVYNIRVNEDGTVPVNQRMGRMIPHLLDPQSDMRVVNATRIEP